METVTVELKIPRLMMHNEQLADPLNQYAKALKAVTSKKKKTDDDHMEIAQVEFQGGLYFDDEIGPYVPSSWLMGTIIEGARRNRLGREFEAFVMVEEDRVPLKYDGPRTREKLWSDKRFIDRRCVGNMGNRVVRTRPRFDNCTLRFTVQIFDGGPNIDAVEDALNIAGQAIGIGDGRPRFAGKFVVEKFEVAGRKKAAG